MRSLRDALGRQVDAAGVLTFRRAFGLLAAFAAARFMAKGWVSELLIEPEFHFRWIASLPLPSGKDWYVVLAVQVVGGLMLAWGKYPKKAAALWLAAFGCVELLDKAMYLNHYVLMSIVGALLVVAPIPATSRIFEQERCAAWVVYLLRAVFGFVYVWAGIAKLNADWLMHAEPLATWLGAREDLPVLGPLLANQSSAYAMSWGGAIFDLSIFPLLMWARTRRFAFGLVLVFHVSVGLLFPIGVFPAVMVVGATLFLAPSWPRRWARPPEQRQAPAAVHARASKATASVWVGVVACLALLPGRYVLQFGNPNWDERGHRFAWRVLVNEKSGFVEYRVVTRDGDQQWKVSPSMRLTPFQHSQMRTQPDMIRDYARHLAHEHHRQGREVAVFVDAWASLNHRPAQRLIRPDVDLTLSLPELERANWIVPPRDRG